MKELKTYITQVLQDTHGSYSSKRAVTFLCTALISIGYMANLFWDQTVDQFMFDSIMYIVIAGLGFSGAEKFAPAKTQTPSA
jgi:hypothetical protein